MASDGVLSRLAATDRLLVQQVFKPVGNEYRISVPSPGSTEEGVPVLFVRQKKLAIKEDIRFRLSPDGDDRHLFRIRSKTVFEFAGKHDVVDDHDQLIGSLGKAFGKSLLRSHWYVYDAQGRQVLEAQEASLAVALIRRFIGFIPLVGDYLGVLQWLPFNFVLRRGEDEVGRYARVLGKLRDRYVLELQPGAAGDVDRRLLVAFAVALDALQDR
ncbi:MAG: hypothetical protein AB1416_01875 [Actinomycetota bacterium]